LTVLSNFSHWKWCCSCGDSGDCCTVTYHSVEMQA